MRPIFFLLVIGLALWVLRSRGRDASSGPQRKAPPPVRPDTEEMVPCVYCGIHVPRVDCVQGHRGLYCSPEHLRLGE